MLHEITLSIACWQVALSRTGPWLVYAYMLPQALHTSEQTRDCQGAVS